MIHRKKINMLYLEFARVLQDVKPKAFIVENVSGMARANFSHLLADQFQNIKNHPEGWLVTSYSMRSDIFGQHS